MKIELTFKHGVTTEVVVPEENLLFNAEPLKTGNVPDQERIVEESLDNPIGTDRLENILKPEMNVVILCDDITRPTPTAKILPQVMKRIEKAGIPDSQIKIIMAPGTHRPMTDEELEIKLGRPIMGRYNVFNRDYKDSSKFIYLGTTKSGIPVELDREVYEADFVIGLGNIIPHISAGWSGGAKIILPGICSSKTTDMMHYVACVAQPVLEVFGTSDNIPRMEMEEIAEKAGLSFIVNTVLDDKHNMQGVFSGHFIKAHRKGAELAEKLMVVPIPRQADILIVSANPCYFDYWQGIKPYAYSHRAVREGGALIFILDGIEHLCGDAPSHEPTLRKYLSWTFEDMKKEVENGKADDIVGMNVPMYHSTLRNRVKNYIITNYMTQEEIELLNFERADTVQDALSKAFKLIGSDAKVGIIPYGGETLTRVNMEDFEKLQNETL